jgi:regulator of nucleoside diphosphate kinase
LSVGQEIEWPAPGGGIVRVRIIDILYQPERSGDFRL